MPEIQQEQQKYRFEIWLNLKRYALSVRRKFMFTANGRGNWQFVLPAAKRSPFRMLKAAHRMRFRVSQLVLHAVQHKSFRRKYLTAANVPAQNAAVLFCICRISLSNARTNFRRIKMEMPALPVPTADGTMF